MMAKLQQDGSLNKRGLRWMNSQTCVQRSPLGNGKGNRYMRGGRYIQVNFVENIRQLKNVWKLSGDRKMEGHRYIQGRYIQV